MSVLDKICARKKQHIAHQKTLQSLGDVKAKSMDAPKPRGFSKALLNGSSPAIIAEVKKASPSKGIIRDDFDPAQTATIYQDNGAACLSVLTDEPYFQGTDSYLQDVIAAVHIPVLRKDFMLEPYQIYESRGLGADCVLLIMAALDDSQAQELYDLSTELGMDVLVEVHNLEELERAVPLNPRMVGVNNRNLKTLEVDVQTSFDLMSHMPEDVIKIAESGLKDYETLHSLEEAGYHAFLVGESLMREHDIAAALKKLRNTN